MITKEDIKKLADLARIEISPDEAESLTTEIDSILGYVGQINVMPSIGKEKVPLQRNIMRDDVVTHGSGQYTEDLLSNAPFRERNLLKVKKIL
ncbi:MAG: Asp-tRNA(Asn)/Glu-tRNA(Gln) amidotransferase subunit GatC [Candidatus Paceibacterota bacterium]|jgi:aspartyl-tRNA(Asn)/glutamyl-tRNA(Gln) amidotransferase subunit C